MRVLPPSSQLPQAGLRGALVHALARVEDVFQRGVVTALRRRPGWRLVVVPYAGHGTRTQVHVLARVLLRRSRPADSPARPVSTFGTALRHYLTVEVPGEPVGVQVGDRQLSTTADREGYVRVTLDVGELDPGWQPVTFELPAAPDGRATGQVLVVDPAARLGLVSDVDDTVIRTGLTRLVEAVRTTLLVPEDARTALSGGAELYRGLVAGDSGRAPVFYVSTGAWNLHGVLERFIVRHGFPVGPLLMTDWGPGQSGLFRQNGIAYKTSTIAALLAEHAQLSWVLVGDSGQDDAEAYAAVARSAPQRIRAIYIRDAPPPSPARTQRVRRLADELAGLGVPMLLIEDSVAAAEHAAAIGLLAGERVAEVRAAVESAGSPAARS